MLSTRPHPRPSRQNMTHIQPGEEMTPISQSEASVGWWLTNQRPPLSLSLSRLTNKSRSWVKTQLTDLGVQGSLDFTILSSLISAPTSQQTSLSVREHWTQNIFSWYKLLLAILLIASAFRDIYCFDKKLENTGSVNVRSQSSGITHCGLTGQ